jgi:Domain of unknown function (DUF4190)
MSDRRDDDVPEVRPVRRRPRLDDDYDDPPPYDIGQDAGMRMLLPVGLTGWAIASGYLGLISVLLIPAPFALLTGILAIITIRRNPKKHGMGRAIFGIIMGTIFTIALGFALVGFIGAAMGKR